jgi:hypothetical protein
MNPRRFCFVLLSLCMAAGLGTGCGDDDEKEAGGGRGGGAGRGGTSGGAGTGGKAGNGGSSGMDASSDAPSDTGPEADAGDARPLIRQCVERCTSNEDCRMDEGSSLVDCSERGRCELPIPICTKRSDCFGIASGWFVPCDAAEPCAGGMACVDIGQRRGVCAPLPGDGGCSVIFHPVTMPAFDRDAGSVQVCGDEADYDCDEGACYRRICTTSAQCTEPRSFCVVEKGICGCAGDLECSAELGGAKCNQRTRRCGCVTDADCAGVTNADRCIDGVCGCSGTAVCTAKAFSGTTVACE